MEEWAVEGQRERDKKKIDVLLQEYQACHINRSHYDATRWSIGSIFIAASLAIFGFSFMEGVNLSGIYLMSWAAIILVLIWWFYDLHVSPWVLESIIRIHQIELELYKMGFDVRLHYSVRRNTKNRLIGRIGFLTIFILVFLVWIFRVTMESLRLWWWPFMPLLHVIGLALFLFCQFSHWLSSDYSKRIDSIIREREKLEKYTSTSEEKISQEHKEKKEQH